MAQAAYQRALELAKRESYSVQEVLTLLTDADKAGSPEASYALGTWYLFGKNVRKNHVKAVEFLKRAARFDIPNAAFDLAVCYEKGSGVEKNQTTAFAYYLKAAKLGDHDASYEVGRCYYHGIGTKQDRGMARIFLLAWRTSKSDKDYGKSWKGSSARRKSAPTKVLA